MPDLPVLDAVGSSGSRQPAGKKQVTVPASYPLSLNGLRTALQPDQQPRAGHRLRRAHRRAGRPPRRQLTRRAAPHRLGRHRAAHPEVPPDPRRGCFRPRRRRAGLLTVLLLRGPQAPGELDPHRPAPRVRRPRPVESTLRAMAERPGGAAPAGGDRDAAGCTCWVRSPRSPPRPSRPPRRRSRWRGPTRATAGADVVRRRGDRVRRHAGSPSSTGCRSRPVAAGPGRGARRRRPGRRPRGRGRLRAGHVTAYLADAGADATGLDLSPGWSPRRGGGSRTAPTRSATCGG